jgi:hypothetical protein
MENVGFYCKAPADCTEGELDRYLSHKNIQYKKLKKSEKIELVKGVLAASRRHTIIFKSPKSVLGKAVFTARKFLDRKNITKNPFLSDELVPTAPSVVSGHEQFLNPFVESTPKQRLPFFNPGSIVDTNSILTGSEHEGDSKMRVPPQIPPRLHETNPFYSENSQVRSSPNTPKINEQVRFKPVVNFSPAVTFSPVELNRGSVHENYRAQSLNNEISRVENDQYYSKDQQEMSRNQTNSRINVANDRNKYKFELKYDSNTITIEHFLKSLERWRLSNDASDEKAIFQGLNNFKNVALANNISETLSLEALGNFEIFSEELRSRLGNSPREWYRSFNTTRRQKSETCYEFFSKLVSELKMGLQVTMLSHEHKAMLLEKFLSELHPELRGLLEIREPEVTFENVALVAHKIETIKGIPRVACVSINNFEKKSAKLNFSRADRENWFCDFCQNKGHTRNYCFKNPESKSFNLERFEAAENARNFSSSKN